MTGGGPPPPEVREKLRQEKLATKRAEKFEEIRIQSKALLAAIETDRVVVVDDRAWPVDTYLEALGIPADPPLEDIDPAEEDPDEAREIKARRIREKWPQLGPAQRKELVARAQEILSEQSPSRALTHLETLTAMFPPGAVELVEPAEWDERREELIGEEAPPLVFFDHVLEGYHETGLDLLSAYLEASPDQVARPAGILSGEVDEDGNFRGAPDGEPTEVPPGELMMMSKVHLQEGQLDKALALLRLTANLPNLIQARMHVLDGLEKAVATARAKLEDLPPRVLEDLVYRSSEIEGAWEGETMARVIGLRVVEATREAQRKDNTLKYVIAQARQLSTEAPVKDERSHGEAEELLRIESYAPGEWINALQLPLANGDIFELTAGSGDPSHYVLVAQPCDLVVRTTGDRDAGEAALLPIAWHRDPKQTLFTQPLPKEPPAPLPSPAEVLLKKGFILDLQVLDLCWFDDSGVACVEDVDADPAAEMLTVGLTARRDKILEQARAKLVQLNKTEPGDALHTLLLEAFSHSVVRLQHDRELPKRWCYPLRRITRLERPQAEALLVRYSAAQTRAAFDHDLTKLERRTVEAPTTESAN